MTMVIMMMMMKKKKMVLKMDTVMAKMVMINDGDEGSILAAIFVFQIIISHNPIKLHPVSRLRLKTLNVTGVTSQ